MKIRQGSSFKTFPQKEKDAKSIAFEHALDIELMVIEMMERKNLSRKELAKKMGISQSNLSNLLNCQPNMTLETLAKFEIALDAYLTVQLLDKSASAESCSNYDYEFDFTSNIDLPIDNKFFALEEKGGGNTICFQIDSEKSRMRKSSRHSTCVDSSKASICEELAA